MRNLIKLCLSVPILLVLISATANAETFTASLSGAQEVPANASTATGFARVFLDEDAGSISFTVVFNGLQSNQIAAHIHAPGVIGQNGPPVITFTSPGGTSNTIMGTSPITPTLIAQMRAHQAYINIHSVDLPDGEIRGQLAPARPIDNDGDGRMDLTILRFPNVAPPGVAPITWWNLNTTEGVSVTDSFGDANTDFPTPGDYDGDGKTDIALYRDGAVVGAPSTFWIFRSSDNTAEARNFGQFGDQAICRDYNGDGITDLAIFRRGLLATDQAVWWIQGSGEAGATVVPFGTTGNGTTSFDTPVPGDYDGDGKFDVAVYRFGMAPANHFIILRSSDGGVTFQQWGNFQTDWIAPGDFDGDGQFDFVAARTGATAGTPMVWWILQSSDGSVRVQQFGISSDVPTQGDYDGDGVADISIYRGSNSTFWTLNSFSNAASATQWGIQGDFPANRFDAR
jgi:hypothetical protein